MALKASLRHCTSAPPQCGGSKVPARPALCSVVPRSTLYARSQDSKFGTCKAAVTERPASFNASRQPIYEEEDEHEEDDHDVIQVNAQAQDESLLIKNLGLSAVTVQALEKRGIKALFPIQKSVYEPISKGRDIIGRAKTGSGKTLAFSLPVIEALLTEDAQNKPRVGRPPRVIVLAPTRELANQVAREFESAATSLKVISVYGGVSIGKQMSDLERGVDVVVGTPGRVIDLIERRKLIMDKLRFAILDEADQMLDMGFEENMEEILAKAPEGRQTLLFSATLPPWVKKVAKRYQENPLLVDLVGEENTGKLADTISLRAIQVRGSEKISNLLDLLTVYAAGGKAMVFVNTKAKADEVCASINQVMLSDALHGDIAQDQREKSLQRFRDGKYTVMVATDVAARGLDIPSVELVVHYDLPQDNEAFLHRSGRTGRATKTGTAIVMYTENESQALGRILTACKVKKLDCIGAPNPMDVMTSASKTVLAKLEKVDADVIDFFVPAAERLLTCGEEPERIMAAALAAMSGFTTVPAARSLLTSEEGVTTLRIMNRTGEIDGLVTLTRTLKSVLKAGGQTLAIDTLVGRIKLLEDSTTKLSGAAFDVPASAARTLMACCEAAQSLDMTLDMPKYLSMDVSQLMLGRRGGPPRSDRGPRSWDSRDRGGYGGGRSSFGGDRGRGDDRRGGHSAGSGGRARDAGYGGRDRDAGLGGRDRDAGFGSRDRAPSFSRDSRGPASNERGSWESRGSRFPR